MGGYHPLNISIVLPITASYSFIFTTTIVSYLPLFFTGRKIDTQAPLELSRARFSIITSLCLTIYQRGDL